MTEHHAEIDYASLAIWVPYPAAVLVAVNTALAENATFKASRPWASLNDVWFEEIPEVTTLIESINATDVRAELARKAKKLSLSFHDGPNFSFSMRAGSKGVRVHATARRCRNA